MIHPCVAATAHTIQTLRDARISGAFDPQTRLSAGVYFSADMSQGGVEIDLAALEGGLFSAKMRVTGMPEWVTLNISLGNGAFQVGDTIGIVSDLRAKEPFEIRPFIRSDCAGVQYDTTLAEDLKIAQGSKPGTLLHSIRAEDPLTYGKAFHTLVLPLPKRNVSFAFHDFRLIHVSASEGLLPRADTLGGLTI